MMKFQPKTDWKYDDIPTEGDFNRIEQGIDEAHKGVQLSNQGLLEVKQQIGSVEQLTAAHSTDYVKHQGFGITTGENNNYSITLSPSPKAYVDGMFIVIAVHLNSSGGSTLNINGLGSKPLKRSDGSEVTDLKQNGIYTFRYSATTEAFVLQEGLKMHGNEFHTEPYMPISGGDFTGPITVNGKPVSGSTEIAEGDWNNYMETGFYVGVNLLHSPPRDRNPNLFLIWEKESTTWYVQVIKNGDACIQKAWNMPSGRSMVRTFIVEYDFWTQWFSVQPDHINPYDKYINYYISEDGNDENDGYTQATAMKTIYELEKRFKKYNFGERNIYIGRGITAGSLGNLLSNCSGGTINVTLDNPNSETNVSNLNIVGTSAKIVIRGAKCTDYFKIESCSSVEFWNCIFDYKNNLYSQGYINIYNSFVSFMFNTVQGSKNDFICSHTSFVKATGNRINTNFGSRIWNAFSGIIMGDSNIYEGISPMKTEYGGGKIYL